MGLPTNPPPGNRWQGPGKGPSNNCRSNWQQQPTRGPVSPRALHALDLYRECVESGQWASLYIEQLPEGDIITLLCRPAAATTAAAKKKRRRPNPSRIAKQAAWRARRQQRKQQQQREPLQTTLQATVSNSSQQQQQPVATVSSSSPSRQLAGLTAATNSYAAVAAQMRQPPPPTSRETRSAKKRKATHPPDAASPPPSGVCGDIPQLDGATSPPSTLSPLKRSPPTPGDDSISSAADSSTAGDNSSAGDSSSDGDSSSLEDDDSGDVHRLPCVHLEISPLTGRCRECFIQLMPTPVW